MMHEITLMLSYISKVKLLDKKNSFLNSLYKETSKLTKRTSDKEFSRCC